MDAGHLLFVEDEPDLREIMTLALIDQGYTVTVAPDGSRALAELRGDTRFAFVITDVSMPGGVTGFDVAAAAHSLQPQAHVVIASGYQRSQLPALPDRVRFLPKPYRIRQLIGALEPVPAA